MMHTHTLYNGRYVYLYHIPHYRGHGYSFSFTLRALEESGLGFSVNGRGFMRVNHIRGLASSQAL